MRCRCRKECEKVQKSRWNRWYKEVRTVRLSRYLKERGKEKSMIRIARFRLKSEMREERY